MLGETEEYEPLSAGLSCNEERSGGKIEILSKGERTQVQVKESKSN
jgi:hypothetical protein